MEKIKSRKKEIIFILFVSTFFIPIVYAILKYSVLGGSGLTLATWSVTLNQTNVNNSLSIIPEPNEMVASYTVNITSASEVDVIYSIVVDNLPTGISVSLDGGAYIPETNHKVVLTNDKTILYNDNTKSRSHILTFKAATGVQTVANSEIDIDVVAKQLV